MTITKEQFKGILIDYQPDNSIFSEEDIKINRLKNIIYYHLDEVDKRCLLLYCELGTYKKLGNELGVSSTSAFYKIKEIKNKIKTLYYDNN